MRTASKTYSHATRSVAEWFACSTQVQKGLIAAAAELVAALFRVVRVTAGLVESNGILPPIHVTCRLTAKNRDQLQNPTLGRRVWTTFTFTLFTCYMGQ